MTRAQRIRADQLLVGGWRACNVRSASKITSSEAIEGLLTLVRAGEPILDVTHGKGCFWKDSRRRVIKTDILHDRAIDCVADFSSLPFAGSSVPTVVFDPPFHPFVGSAENNRYSGMGKNTSELRTKFDDGLRECARVSSRHIIVKCQGFVHNHKPQWMPLWCVSALGEPFEWLVVFRDNKRESSTWKSNRSLRRNHVDYLVFDKKGTHR